MSGKKTLIFDFDGTIADTLPFIFKILKDMAREHAIDIPPVDIEWFRNKTAFELIKLFKVPFYKIPFLVMEGQNRMKSYLDEIPPFEGMHSVLSILDKNYQMGILTSNSEENVAHFLKRHNLDFFEFIFSQKHIFGKDKSLYTLIKQYRVIPHEAVYIGDEVRDVEASKKVNIDVISVSWGFNSKEILEKYNPGNVIHKPEELLKMLT